MNRSRLKLLWENPSPTSSFAAQTITLASDDYDYLKFFFGGATNNVVFSQDTLKGCNTELFNSWYWSGGTSIAIRKCTYVSDTEYSIAGSTYFQNGTYTDNANCVIKAIYGGKFAD